MNSLWWLALPTLLLPVWWHRKKRVQVAAEPLASARFLPRTEPRQMRVWRWADVILMIVRCLLLACLIAWLADPVLPWRGNTVVVAEGTDAAWVEQHLDLARARVRDVARTVYDRAAHRLDRLLGAAPGPRLQAARREVEERFP